MSMIGKTLAHYEITSQLGKGGMGEVYQAKDRKLGRDVAIKVLPEEFARDADRVARFQREAKLLASLNHTNIAAIYGLEESEGTNFLVLELVKGETLADRIKAGPVPVEESLKLALQIAEALEAAHEKGVIHRDLKPANIKVTPEGKVKVLDFGLAKAFAGDREEVNLSNSPTLSNAATQQGVILGTAAYMSPEQASGKAVDKRTDVWAFGVVLYEMLTSRSLFAGENVSQTLARVLERQPDFSKLPPNLHPKIIEMLERCLEKDAKNRYHDIADARVDIQKALADPGGVFVQPITGMEPRRNLRTILPWAAAALFLGLIIAGVAVWKLKPPEPRRVVRFDYELPEDQQFSDLSEPLLAVSPDGNKFVYCTSAGLFLRSFDKPTAELIAGSDKNPRQPFFSPDGQWVGYWSKLENKLKKIAISGGAPVPLTDAFGPNLSSWDVNDQVEYFQLGRGVMRISANGGIPETIIKEDKLWLGAPQILPDGKSVLFNSSKAVVQSLKSGQRKELFQADGSRYIPTGHIVYSLGNTLFAIPFDLDRLEVSGGQIPLVNDVASPQWAVSDSGTLVYLPGRVTAALSIRRTLVWVDRKGKEEPLAIAPNRYHGLSISPDGTSVALTVETNNNTDIWTWDLVRSTLTRLTRDAGGNHAPVWTPDGKRIAFSSNPSGDSARGDIYWKAADGTAKEERLTSAQNQFMHPGSWSRDGKNLITRDFLMPSLNSDIGAISMEGDRKWKPLLKDQYNELQPKISLNGRWIAYTSDESGQNEVYVRPFPEVDKMRRQVSTSGGDSPLWSRDGREIFYRSGDAVMAVSVKTDPGFTLDVPKTLFRGLYVSLSSSSDEDTWDISPDAKRFLMIKEPKLTASSGGSPRKINIVLNWLEELKQRVPVK
jgi:serine/threonine protein kinase